MLHFHFLINDACTTKLFQIIHISTHIKANEVFTDHSFYLLPVLLHINVLFTMPFKPSMRLNTRLARQLINNVDNFLLDCDGVIWHGAKAIPGSVDCINMLKRLGKRCFFVTNNSMKTRQCIIGMLERIGVANVTESDIVCTSWVLASYLKSIDFKHKVYMIGSPAMAKELEQCRIEHTGVGKHTTVIDINTEQGHFDYTSTLPIDPDVKCVAVGFDHFFSYPKMIEATTYAYKKPDVLFIATDDEAVFPQPKIIFPCTGTLVSALKTSIGREPLLLGKPSNAMWEVLVRTHQLDPTRSCMVGDRLDTDIAFAANSSLGYSLAVLSGVTDEAEIMGLSQLLESSNASSELESNKLVPDFYANCLGDLNSLISNDIIKNLSSASSS